MLKKNRSYLLMDRKPQRPLSLVYVTLQSTLRIGPILEFNLLVYFGALNSQYN